MPTNYDDPGASAEVPAKEIAGDPLNYHDSDPQRASTEVQTKEIAVDLMEYDDPAPKSHRRDLR